MMGERRVDQGRCSTSLRWNGMYQRILLRAIDRFVEFDGLRASLTSFYSTTGRPSIDPELLIRMLIVGYCFGIRSEHRLCEEVHLNLAYRWFCRLGLDGDVPDHSTFSKSAMAAAPPSSPTRSRWTPGTRSSAIPPTLTPSWTASFTMPPASTSAAKACAAPVPVKLRRIGHRPVHCNKTPVSRAPQGWAQSCRNTGRHDLGAYFTKTGQQFR